MADYSDYLERLKVDINTWVEMQLEGYKPRKIKGNKIFKDPVWGMTSLTPLETNIVDCPLIQRLRRIHQTGLSYLTYPAALHKRFDHSIGMLNCATRMIYAINERFESRGRATPFSRKDIQEIRIASLLHDVGHSCLSHLTEPYFNEHPNVVYSLKEIEKKLNVIPNIHELLGRLIVTSTSFSKTFGEILSLAYAKNEIDDVDATLSRVGDMIIGYPPDGKLEDSYKSEVINGSYDADKMDYIFRDSYFTGIALSSDIERVLFGLSVDYVPFTKRKSIVLDVNAISAYDQLIFSRISLYSNVYNHQKILAVNQMIESILDRMNADPSIMIKGVTLSNPVNFLSLTDWDFLVGESTDPEVTEMQKRIARRDLLLRFLRISRRTIVDEDLSIEVMNNLVDKEKRRNLRNLICRGINVSNSKFDSIRIAVPISTKFKEKVEAYCKHFDNTIVPVDEVFPMSWIQTYDTNKWVAHIYGFQEHLNNKNFKLIKEIVEKELNIKLNDKSKPKISH
jgi:HD superfamily phosphohydrolase